MSNTPLPFNGFQLDGVYLAAVLSMAAENSDPGNGQAAIQAYSQCSYKQYNLPPPYPSAYLFYTPTDLVAVFQGTTSVTQWIYNVLGSAQAHGAGVPGSVDVWFYAAALATFQAMQADIAALQPGRRFTLTGASLGGAIAQLVYQLAGQIGIPSTSVYVFGCPRVGDPVYAVAFQNNTLFRIENLDDPIPQLPPVIWAGVGSHFPIPGPPPVAIYQHAGQSRTLNYQGYLVNLGGQTALDLIVNALNGSQPIQAHYQAEYVRRLGLQLPLSYAGAGADFGVENAAINTITDPAQWRFLPMAANPQNLNKVEVFYAFQGDGFSEIWYSTAQPTALVNSLIPAYVTNRLALATAGVSALYARVSQIGKPRQVLFWAPGFAYTPAQLGQIKGQTSGNKGSIVPQPYNGTYNGFDVQPQQALLVRMLNQQNVWSRLFLHGFPAEVITGGFYTPTPGWINSFAAFRNFLIGANSGWLSQYTSFNNISARISVASITANPGRGATIVYNVPNPQPPGYPPVVGNQVTVGGAGATEVGMNGRKVVIGTVPPNAQGQPGIVVGGASPIGSGPQTGQAYFYIDVMQTAALQDMQIERLTTRKVGKPVFEPVGRRRNTLALRR